MFGVVQGRAEVDNTEPLVLRRGHPKYRACRLARETKELPEVRGLRSVVVLSPDVRNRRFKPFPAGVLIAKYVFGARKRCD